MGWHFQDFIMPELPEVETTRRGLEPWLLGRTVARVVLRTPKLRWPFTPGLQQSLVGQTVRAVERRGKYLLLRFAGGTVILHLGMTGRLHLVQADLPAGRHDHVDILFTDGSCLRFNDARRFGALLFTPDDPAIHPLLIELGPEPFAVEMTGGYLYQRSRGRKVAVKSFIMDHRVLVGVGNIYASEALFRAAIHPGRAAGQVSLTRYERLAEAIRQVLTEALAAGGTTMRDFLDAEGRPGYFSQQLQVYGRGGEPCLVCGRSIRVQRIGGRSAFYCSHCQR
jgi:formamidopyrimidine-DNA glycosylase